MKTAAALCLVTTAAVFGQAPGQTISNQTEQDAYTRIELRSPETGAFSLVHEVAATTAGARTYSFQPWPQTRASVIKATDLMTGAALVTGTAVAGSIEVRLARPVPKDGQGRIRIEIEGTNTSLFQAAERQFTFTMPDVSPRATVVLPTGYELLATNLPAQVLSESDGRIAVSVMHQIPVATTLTLTARSGVTTSAPKPSTNARSWEGPAQRSTERARLSERATQDRDIVYFLQSPETNAFSLYHDYTETRPGVDTYLNVVRTGAQVSNPSAYILDTGEVLKHDVLKGDAITAAKIAVNNVTPETEVVVLHFPAVTEGQSVRLRISETYTTPESYRLDGTDLVFERSLGRARNSVVLPAGWYLTASSIPAIVRQTPEGLIRLDFVNGRPEGIDVLIKGRKR
ncbi:MAG: hypothetical protein HQ485_01700 [Acidobacteria bacterium]|nr:hypothetical protein [Acidobacteriota bacterium]